VVAATAIPLRMSEGVEWAAHTCLNLSRLPEDRAAPTTRLASLFDLPAPYLNKQLQALAHAGIASSVPGPNGGFRLARRPKRITLLDVVLAIEGHDPVFRCREIRQHGPFGDQPDNHAQPCAIANALADAELTWQRHLRDQTIGDLQATVERNAPKDPKRTRAWLLGEPT
jgi:Rrf2 family protein